MSPESAPQHASAADPLSDALECLSLQSWVPRPLELASPWGIEVTGRWGWFYLVIGGPCLLELNGRGSPSPIAAGDLIVVSQGCAHRLRSDADSPTVPIQDLLNAHDSRPPRCRVCGKDEGSAVLSCGSFHFDDLRRSPLCNGFPPLIHIRGEGGRPVSYAECIFRLLQEEVASREPSAPIVVNRLIRVLLLKAIQGYVSRLPRGGATWLHALHDPHIGPVIELIHAQPQAAWTVASLAEHAAMSRSAFSAHFTAIVGKPPMEYLAEWRMAKAGRLLRTTRAELKEIAAQVGYDSAAAFSKAFSRWSGRAPGAYRHDHATSSRNENSPASHWYESDDPPVPSR